MPSIEWTLPTATRQNVNFTRNQKKMSDLALATQQLKNQFTLIDGGKKGLSAYSLPKGICTVKSIIPAPVQAMLKSQFDSVGINFDIQGLTMAKDNKQQIKALRETVELIKNSQALLPELKKALVAGMKAATKQAKFNRDIAVECLTQQAKIDKAQADVLIAMAGYAQKRTALELKLEYKVKRLQKTQEAQARNYVKSWGEASQYIDSRQADLASLAKKRFEDKTRKSQADTQLQGKRIDYANLDD